MTTVDAFTRLTWRVTHEAPVITAPPGSPIIADPIWGVPPSRLR